MDISLTLNPGSLLQRYLQQCSSNQKPRVSWPSSLSGKLIEEVNTQGICFYPPYIKKTSDTAKWNLLPLHTEGGFTVKLLKERFYEINSEKIDQSKFTLDEDAFILEETPKHMKNGRCEWTKISSLLFERLGDPEGLYRSSSQIKNRYPKLTKHRHKKKISAPPPKKRARTKPPLDDPDSSPPSFKILLQKDPTTGRLSIKSPSSKLP
jgi:hypothetical protein